MSKCSDCMHFSLCDYNTDVSNTPIKIDFDEGAEKCSFFKDKARYVELPCKIGDTIYCLAGSWGTYYEKDVCTGFFIDKDCDIHVQVSCKNGNHATYNEIGKTGFFTREEAEQALKEKT